MLNWTKVELIILSKIGVLSYWYFGLKNYIPFLAFFTFSLIAIYIVIRPKYTKQLEHQGTIEIKTLGSIIYGTIVLSSAAVALLDIIMHFYIQRSIPAEDFVERLNFLTKPEIAAGETLVQYLFTLLIPALFLIKNKGNLFPLVFGPPKVPLKKGLLLCLLYCVAILSSVYIIIHLFSIPPKDSLFSLPWLFQRLKVSYPTSSYLYFVLIILLISTTRELLFRGLIYNSFKEKLGLKSGLVLQCFLFSIFYSGFRPFTFSIFFITGFFLTLLYEQTKSIYHAIALHGALVTIPVILVNYFVLS
jgi:membrane protease YdiL (CAAX protease family)